MIDGTHADGVSDRRGMTHTRWPLSRDRFESMRAWLLGAYAFGLAASITLSEATLAVLFCMLVLGGRGARRGPMTWPLGFSLLAFAAATIVSALGSADPWASLRVSGQTLWVLVAVWAVFGTLPDVSAARRFVSVLLTFVALVAVCAILQVALCSAPHADTRLVAWFFHKCERARGFFSTPLTEAGVLMMVLVAVLPRLLQAPAGRLWLWGRWLVSATALALTYVRGAWIAAVVAVTVTLLLDRRRFVIHVFGMVGLVALLLSLPGTLDRARSIGNRSDPSTADRVAMIRAGLHMWRDYPVFGTGVGFVKRLYPQYATPDAIRRSTGHLHNTPLQIVVERGAPGLVAWIGIWVAFFLRTGRALTRIPGHATDDRWLLLGCMLATTGFLIAGFTEYNFGDTEVLLVVCSLMGVALVIEREWDGAAGVSASGHTRRLVDLMRGRWRSACLVLLTVAATASTVSAQEAVGRRVFSDTLVIAEPFVEDELAPSFLRVLRPRNGEAMRAWATEFGGDVKKRLRPDLELSVSSGLLLLDPETGARRSGAENLDIGLKYEVWRSEAREAVASVAVGWEVGGTGAKAVGAEAFDTVRAAGLAGQGFGNLPERLRLFRPLAITESLGAIIPTNSANPDRVQWGGVIQYSLPYLTTYVSDVRVPEAVKRLIPLVEMDFQTALDRGAAGKTTGTINLGGVWIGRALQLGVELVIPANDRTSPALGVRAFIRIGLEQLSPRLGRPLLGAGRPRMSD